MRTIIIFMFLIVSMTVCGKENTVVWNHPTTEYGTNYEDGYFKLALDVTKVDLKTNETVVYITASLLSNYDYPQFRFQFSDKTYLKVGGQRYTILSSDGIELNQSTQTNKDFKLDMAFHFPALPQDTKSFDLIDCDSKSTHQIKGIKPVEERWKQLFPSYWRDRTGDWKLAFYDDFAIYQCKFWDYKQCDTNPKTGETTILMSDGTDELQVCIGKNKKGKRIIQIGKNKAVYSMITSRFMPDYPKKDLRETFIDNGYKFDTVTIAGWLKDMPEHYDTQKPLDLSYYNPIIDEQETVYADLDERGRFKLKIPIINSSEFFIDRERCFTRMPFEPGYTYFMLYDFKEGRRYFMGDDCRLQNELFKYPLDWNTVSLEHHVTDFSPYIASTDSLIKTQYAVIDQLCQEHPTLSARYHKFRKDNTLMQQASEFIQAHYKGPYGEFSDSARQYAYDTFWEKYQQPYTLHRECVEYTNDYLDYVLSKVETPTQYSIIKENITECASNEEELATLNHCVKLVDSLLVLFNAASTLEEKIKIADKVNAENTDLTEKVTKIIESPRIARLLAVKESIAKFKKKLSVIDSLNINSSIRDLYISKMAYDHITHNHCSLFPEVLDTLRKISNCTSGIEYIEKINNKYIAIENREYDSSVFKSSDSLKDISEGEQLLKKLLEPLKGKFVLLDIWGTWCNPCVEALKHSAEEYAYLRDFDIEYLYLAYNSPKELWERVVKVYNVMGDNVSHYNLPDKQQIAIQRYLNVTSFPSYKLFDRNGNLVDVKVDARDLEGLAKLLKQLE